MATIAFLGLGQMGSPMANNLLQKGHSLQVFDVNAQAVDALVTQGATAAQTPAEAAAGAEFIITMLPNGDIVRQVLLGEKGVCEAVSSDALLIDMSTMTWIPPEIFQQFMFEFLDTPRYAQWNIKVHYSQFTGEWNIEGKSYDRSNVKAYSTYGTSRINAYKIIEETLNLKDVRIFDYIEDDEGKKKAVLNKKETAIAQAKQELIKQGFQDWIWADPTGREKLTPILL